MHQRRWFLCPRCPRTCNNDTDTSLPRFDNPGILQDAIPFGLFFPGSSSVALGSFGPLDHTFLVPHGASAISSLGCHDERSRALS